MSFLAFLHRAVEREDLSFDQARAAMSALLEGGATPALTAAFLVALRMKGETAEELAGFASAMREHMIPVELSTWKSGPEATSGRSGIHVVDSCGTGGDSSGTFNISTTAAFVMAGAGAIVAKHGNRSVSSTTGSADVLEALGVSVTATAEEAAQRLQDIGIAFLFAPAFHPAMKHVQPVRRELKIRTVFNLLGPLANPARAQAQVIGVPSMTAAKLMADALARLGAHRVFVVHGSAGDSNVPGAPTGVDEISISGPTEVLEVRGNKVTPHVWRPAMFGVGEAPIEALAGGDAQRECADRAADPDGGERSVPRHRGGQRRRGTGRLWARPRPSIRSPARRPVDRFRAPRGRSSNNCGWRAPPVARWITARSSS